MDVSPSPAHPSSSLADAPHISAASDDGWVSLYCAQDVRDAPASTYGRRAEAMSFLQESWQTTAHAARAWSNTALALLPSLLCADRTGFASPSQALVPRKLPGRTAPIAALSSGRLCAGPRRLNYIKNNIPGLQELQQLEALLKDLAAGSLELSFEMFCYLSVVAADLGVPCHPWQRGEKDMQGPWRRLMLQLHPDKLSCELDRYAADGTLSGEEARQIREVAKAALDVFDQLVHHTLLDPRLQEQASAHRARHPHIGRDDMRRLLRLKHFYDDVAPGLQAARRLLVGACQSAVTGALCAAHTARAAWIVTTPLRADMAQAARVGAASGADWAVRVGLGITCELHEAWQQHGPDDPLGQLLGRLRRVVFAQA